MGSCCCCCPPPEAPAPSPAPRPVDPARIGTKHVDQVLTGTDDATGQAFVNEYTFVRQLGAGKFGTLNLCAHYQSREPFAVREVARQVITQKDLFSAGIVLKNLRHPHIIQLFEIIDDPRNEYVYLVLEYVNAAEPILALDLNGHARGPPLDEPVCQRHFAAVCDALEYLHGCNVVHGNIQPSSILLEGGQVVKLSSLDVGNLLQGDDDARRRLLGNPYFMAPEACQGRYFSGKLHDIWQLGITLYCCAFGRVPFVAKGSELHVDIQTREVSFPGAEDGSGHPPPSPALCDLIARMLNKNPILRITIGAVKDHPWLTGEMEEDADITSSRHDTVDRCSICTGPNSLLEEDPARTEALVKSTRALIAADVYLIGCIASKILSTALECNQLVIDQVTSVQEAVSSCEARPYQIVMIDVHLPRVNGMGTFDAVRAIRHAEAEGRWPVRCFIVGLTAEDSGRCRAAAGECGMNDLLKKPLMPSAFRSSCSLHQVRTRSGYVKVRQLLRQDNKKMRRRGHAIANAYDDYLRRNGETPSEPGSVREVDLFPNLPKPSAHASALPAPHKTHFVEAADLLPFGVAFLLQRLLAADRGAPMWFPPRFYTTLSDTVNASVQRLPVSARPGRHDDRVLHSHLEPAVAALYSSLTAAFTQPDRPVTLPVEPGLHIAAFAHPFPALDPTLPPVHSCAIVPYLRHLCRGWPPPPDAPTDPPPAAADPAEGPPENGSPVDDAHDSLEIDEISKSDDAVLMLLSGSGELTPTLAECLRYARNLLPFHLHAAPAYPEAVPTALAEAFTATDKKVKDWLLSHDHHNSPGCSALVVVVRGGRLWLANAGGIQTVAYDARGAPRVLAARHVPTDSEEKRRITERGGSVQFRSGTWRVNGTFLTTRALGHSVHSNVITAEPEVFEFQLDGTFRFLVAASGLWAVLSPAAVGALVTEGLREIELSARERSTVGDAVPTVEAVLRRRQSSLYLASRLRSLAQAQADQAHPPTPAALPVPKPRRTFLPLPAGCPPPPEPDAFLLALLGLGAAEAQQSSRISSWSSAASSSGRAHVEHRELPPEPSDYEAIADRGLLVESLVVAAAQAGCGEDLSVILTFFDRDGQPDAPSEEPKMDLSTPAD